MSCMVCKKSDVRLFSVGKNYGTINHTVGDDLVEIYGDKVSVHLSPDSVVCNVCMNILDNMAMLIRNIWSIIANPCEQLQPGQVVKLWKFFASFKIEEDMKDELQNARSKALTPSKLVKLVYSEPYESDEEGHIAEQERMRSISRICSVSNTSEVNKIFDGSEETKTRRKKKGHNWSRTKRGRPKSADSRSASRPRSVDSGSASRPTSGCSTRSTRSSRRSPARKKQIVVYDYQGRLIQKRTRSVSRAQEEQEHLREQTEESKFYCMEKDCTLYFKNLDVLNLHKIMDHGLLALYYCEECQQRYTTSQHLELHLRIHDISSFFCLICGCELANRRELQSHLDQHLVYSVPCKYCDRAFLSKLLREHHIKTAHRGRRKGKRQVYRDELIIDRFDSGSTDKENNVKKQKDYRVKYIYHTDIENESDDMDVTADNFKLKNIDFHQVDDDVEYRPGQDSDQDTDESELRPDESELRPDESELRPDESELRPDDSELIPSDDSELLTSYLPTPS